MKQPILAHVLLAATMCLILPRANDGASYQYDRALSKVVGVICTAPDGEVSRGTGVVVGSGEVVTARHVVYRGGRVEIIRPARNANGDVIGNESFYNWRRKRCRVVASSEERDLSLLKVAEPEEADAIAMTFASARPGQPVFTIGAGSGSLFHFASGSVRQVYRGTYSTQSTDVSGRILEVSVPINPGDSGGPIIDQRTGELVGITLATEWAANQVHKGIDGSEVRAFLREARQQEARRE
jgi:S1-C subfamily serine protease